ncbi:MAG: ATP-dependent DNA helicase RecG [Candidatus Doudnabacteria bacterium]
MDLKLTDKVTQMPGVGPAFSKQLAKLKVKTIADLWYHFPNRYVDFSKQIQIAEAQNNQLGTFIGTISQLTKSSRFGRRASIVRAKLTDKSGSIDLVWFNQPYVAIILKNKMKIAVSGKVGQFNSLQLTNPLFEPVQKAGTKTSKIIPIYPLTKGLTNQKLVNLIELIKNIQIPDYLSQNLLNKFELQKLSDSLHNLHFPNNLDNIQDSQFRIAVDDTLPEQLAVLKNEQAIQEKPALQIPIPLKEIKSFITNLPFNLTNSQKRAIWDIVTDLNSTTPSNRLLQGDVSSGKTMVAILASLAIANHGSQVAILAPTEILAEQHFKTFKEFLAKYKINITLLTQNNASTVTKNKSQVLNKSDVLNHIQTGQSSIVIGTHALLKNKVAWHKLSLVIIDEQHRFGVTQRRQLKNFSVDSTPHLLTMSATPIPRTLALSLYGKLKVSRLLAIPNLRKPILTKLANQSDRALVYQHITKEIKNGNQCFVVTPKINESDGQVKSVKTEFEQIKTKFKQFRVGLIHGQLQSDQKSQVMQDFIDKKLDILVATTVIEIGIDIPDATIIVIEGAERFGLAQLHQLRGRVGRSNKQSYCYIFCSSDFPQEVPRLQIFAQTQDGLALAEYDLKTRGFGDLFGQSQSGFNFKFPAFITIKALQTARKLGQEILALDPTLNNYPFLKKTVNQLSKTIHLE